MRMSPSFGIALWALAVLMNTSFAENSSNACAALKTQHTVLQLRVSNGFGGSKKLPFEIVLNNKNGNVQVFDHGYLNNRGGMSHFRLEERAVAFTYNAAVFGLYPAGGGIYNCDASNETCLNFVQFVTNQLNSARSDRVSKNKPAIDEQEKRAIDCASDRLSQFARSIR